MAATSSSMKKKKLCETPCNSVVQKKSEIRNHKSKHIMEKKDIWSKVLQVIITVLTAIATTFGVTSCMGM